MNEIPTAEAFYAKCREEWDTGSYSPPDPYKFAIEFAKLHVQAQNKAILEKVRLTDFAEEFLQEGAGNAIDKNSILNAYPLINIK